MMGRIRVGGEWGGGVGAGTHSISTIRTIIPSVPAGDRRRIFKSIFIFPHDASA